MILLKKVNFLEWKKKMIWKEYYLFIYFFGEKWGLNFIIIVASLLYYCLSKLFLLLICFWSTQRHNNITSFLVPRCAKILIWHIRPASDYSRLHWCINGQQNSKHESWPKPTLQRTKIPENACDQGLGSDSIFACAAMFDRVGWHYHSTVSTFLSYI